MISLLLNLCITQFGPCPAEYLLDKFLHRRPEVYSVSTRYKFPLTLEKKVILRVPLGTIATSSASPRYIVDTYGQVYSQSQNSALPLLLVPGAIQIGKQVTREQLNSLKALSLLSPIFSDSPTGEFRETDLVVHVKNYEILLDPSNPDISASLASLQQLYSRSRIDGKVPHKLDLRFRNPIITY